MHNSERERIAALVEEFGRETLPPRLGMNLEQSPYTVDQWLEDAWQMAIEGAARVIRESGPPSPEPRGDSVILRYGENWADMFERSTINSAKFRCKVCGVKGYLDPASPPSLKSWTTHHLNGHEECPDCNQVMTIRGMSRHRLIHRKPVQA